ncbi:MAG: thiamine pyrophosphate-binding protein [Chloroflexi bacterium]|nr:thiamine pyrophosphate-binding protein [Chloroflexota bacterium]
MKKYEAFAELFIREGVSTVFGLMGDGNMHWWSSLLQRDVRVHPARHEGSGLSMAEGWARVTGEPGVCTVTMGPGVAQLATALLVASRGSVPIVVFAGEVPNGDEGASQYLDQRRFAEAAEAGFVSASMTAGPEEAVRTAFYRARAESRPILLSAPLDDQLRNVDADFDDYQPSRLLMPRSQRIQPDRDLLAEAAEILAASQRPVIITGVGAVNAHAGRAVSQLADRVGALLATTLPAKGFLGDHAFQASISGLFATRTAQELLAEADCVLAVGASLNAYTIEGGYLFPGARYIQIDRKPRVLMGNGRVADCYLQGDARLTVEALDRHLAERGVASTGYHTDEVRGQLREAGLDEREYPIPEGNVDPREAAMAIDRAAPDDVALLSGLGHQMNWPIFHMKKRREPTLFATAFGCVGQALPTAIGAAVALSPRPLIAFEGDTGTLMQVQELDTAARLGVKLLSVVFNDAALGVEYHKLKSKGLDPEPSRLRSPDFAAVARGFGCRGKTVRSAADATAGVREWLAGDGPMLLDVCIPTQVLSEPFRRLYYGEQD